MLVSVMSEPVPVCRHFSFYKGQLVTEMIPRLLQVIRTKFADRYGDRMVKYILTPLYMCLYLHLLLPLSIRRPVLHTLVQLRRMYRRQFVEYSRNGASTKLPSYQHKLLRMFEKINFTTSERKITIKFSEENVENINDYIFN